MPLFSEAPPITQTTFNAEFQEACLRGKVGTVLRLLETGSININQAIRLEGSFRDKHTPLLEACDSGQVEVVEILLKQPDIDVNLPNKYITPLIQACQRGHTKIVELLLKQPGININALDNYSSEPGSTALWVACLLGHKDIVELLLGQPGIEVNDESSRYLPLYCACDKGFTDIVQMLLNHPDIDINRAEYRSDSFRGDTALLRACLKSHPEIVMMLLKHENININQTNNSEDSPLYNACRTHNSSIIMFLLQHRNLYIPSNPDNYIKYSINKALRATLKSTDENRKRFAVLLYMRGFKPKNPDDNDLYQRWINYCKKHLNERDLSFALHPRSSLREQCLFTIRKHQINTKGIPDSSFQPPMTLNTITEIFFKSLAEKQEEKTVAQTLR